MAIPDLPAKNSLFQYSLVKPGIKLLLGCNLAKRGVHMGCRFLVMFYILVAITQHVASQEPSLNWTHSFGSDHYDRANALTTDSTGHVYVTGLFRDTVDFDPGIGVHNLAPIGSQSTFVQKLDSAGNLVWVTMIGNASSGLGRNIQIDKFGCVYSAGVFGGTTDFDPGAGVFNMTAQASGTYIQKLDPDGNFIWAKLLDGTSENNCYAIAVDDDESVYITGFFSDTADFDPDTTVVYELISNGERDIHATKLDSNGNFVWAKQMGGSDNDYGNSVAVDNEGNVLVTGVFRGTVDFDPGAGVELLTSIGFPNDIFIQKLDDAGDLLWVRRLGGPANESAGSIIVDDSGNVFTAGWFGDSADFDPGAGVHMEYSAGGSDGFVQKLDSIGEFKWVSTLAGQNAQYYSSLERDEYNNLYLTGAFFDTADFDPGIGEFTMIPSGNSDIFIQKLTPSGQLTWASSFPGTTTSFGTSGSMVPDVFGNAYCVGYFGGTIDFDPGLGLVNQTSVGQIDFYVSKLSQCQNARSNITLSACDSLLSPSGNHIWTASGTYMDTIISSGCDSVVTVFLTIDSPETSTITVSACDSLISPSGSYIWTESGTYMDTISGFGCDSIITVILTIDSPDTSTITVSACDSLISPSGSYVWTASGIYMDTISGFGCDSIITVILTIDSPDTSTITVSACDSLVSPSNKYVWTKSGVYFDTLTSVGGCDSIQYVHLTIENSDSVFIDTLVCGSFTSPSGNYLWDKSDTYFDTIISASGCRSLIRVELEVAMGNSAICDTSDCQVLIPNVITPNFDGINDCFNITEYCEVSQTNFQIKIYNRWGLLLWASTVPGMCWDGYVNGEMVTEGIYFYDISFSKHRYSGSFSLIADK